MELNLNENKDKLIKIALVVLILGGGYWGINKFVFSSAEPTEDNITQVISPIDISKFKTKKLNTELLVSDKFKNLKDDNIRLKDLKRIKTGKKNPFEN